MYAVMTSSSLVAPQLDPPIAGSPPNSISNTMSFVKLSIFGTSFEVNLLSFLVSPLIPSSQVTTRYVDLQPVGMGSSFYPHFLSLTDVLPLKCRCIRAGMVRFPVFGSRSASANSTSTHISCSSAKDQLTGASVAIKKIMKPFSTPVLSKRTYRELKLLKHIQHENVSLYIPYPYFPFHQARSVFLPDHQPQRCLHLSIGGYVRRPPPLSPTSDHVKLSRSFHQPYQLFRDGTPRHRSSPTAYVATIREAVYSILFIPDLGMPTLSISVLLIALTLPFSAGSSMSTQQVSSIAIS